MDKQRLVDIARAWLGVPWQHQGRTVNGIDCAGILIASVRQYGIPVEDIAGYSPVPSGFMMKRILLKYCKPISLSEIQVADILHMRFGSEPQHLALVSRVKPTYIIHADSIIGKVVEHILDSDWRSHCRGAYRL